MKDNLLIADEQIISKIYTLRTKKIMLDYDLAVLYCVETKQLKRQVKRNTNRFPIDFMFELSKKEYDSLRSQNGTLKRGEHSKYLPMAFTVQGVAMLASILNSPQAIAVNIQIIRIFTRFRELLISHKDVLIKLELLEKKIASTDEQVNKQSEEIRAIFEALKQLLTTEQPEIKKIGYKRKDEH